MYNQKCKFDDEETNLIIYYAKKMPSYDFESEIKNTELRLELIDFFKRTGYGRCIDLFFSYRAIINEIINYTKDTNIPEVPPNIFYSYTRSVYDVIFNIKTYINEMSLSVYDCGNKYKHDHINTPQIVSGFKINEYIVEGIIYNFKQYSNFFYEMTKTRKVTKEENSYLINRKNKIKEQRYNKRYIDENIKVVNLIGKEVSSEASFPEYLLGDISNRKYTWIPWVKYDNCVKGMWDHNYNDESGYWK